MRKKITTLNTLVLNYTHRNKVFVLTRNRDAVSAPLSPVPLESNSKVPIAVVSELVIFLGVVLCVRGPAAPAPGPRAAAPPSLPPQPRRPNKAPDLVGLGWVRLATGRGATRVYVMGNTNYNKS